MVCFYKVIDDLNDMFWGNDIVICSYNCLCSVLCRHIIPRLVFAACIAPGKTEDTGREMLPFKDNSPVHIYK